MPELTLISALRVESCALGGADLVTGIGPERALRGAAQLVARLGENAPVAVAGVAGGLDPSLQPGDLVVATEVRLAGSEVVHELVSAPLVAAELRRRGLRVTCGPIVSVPRYVSGRTREALVATGAIAVDMESASLIDALAPRPMVVVRAISDSATRSPFIGGARALGVLLRVRPVLEAWAGSIGTREVVLASPRSFCAGVERAIEIVERALERYGSPVFVRRQIVHNRYVVEDLEAKGAVFVQELAEIPDGATVVLAAHGVSPAVRQEAAARPSLSVIDATCPLVAKVHHEARRYASQGRHLVLIGHGDHEEVLGTLGEAPDRFHLVESVEQVEALEFASDEPVAYLTQTTLATDETAEIVASLRRRFTDMAGPRADDICYASQNRQDAVRSLARDCEVVLVVGSANSSNTARLVEVARREGTRAELVEDASEIRLSWLAGVSTVGLTAGASAPERLVSQVTEAIATLGSVTTRELRVVEESVRFPLPTQVR